MLKEEALYGLFLEVRGPHGEIIKEKERIGELGSKAEKEAERKGLQQQSPKDGNGNYNIFTVEFFGNSSYYNPENSDKFTEECDEEYHYNFNVYVDDKVINDVVAQAKSFKELQESYNEKYGDCELEIISTNDPFMFERIYTEEELIEGKLLEYTTYYFGEREYPSKKVDHGEYDPHTGEFADGTTYDDLEEWELEETIDNSKAKVYNNTEAKSMSEEKKLKESKIDYTKGIFPICDKDDDDNEFWQAEYLRTHKNG